MAVENTNDTDSGIASCDVTPVNQESSSLTPPAASTSPPAAPAASTSNPPAESTSTPPAASTSTAPETTTTMEELTTPAAAASSKQESIERIIASETNPDDEDFEDESITERIMGLSEMFPDQLCTASKTAVSKSFTFLSGAYSLTRNLVFFACTSSLILFAPVLLEVERFNAQEMIKQDRNKLMLGPGTAMAGGPSSQMMPNGPAL